MIYFVSSFSAMIVELSKIQFHQQLHPKNHQTAQETAKTANKTAKMAAKGQRVQTQTLLFATTCQFCQAVQPHQGKPNLSKIVQTCPNLSKLAQTCPYGSKRVKPCQNLFKFDYFGVSSNHSLCVYLFSSQILPCAFISTVMNSTMTAPCVYLFLEKYPAL